MIKRTYFFSCQCPRNDGNGSYSFCSYLTTYKSFFVDNGKILGELSKQAREKFIERGIENPTLDITAFNRV